MAAFIPGKTVVDTLPFAFDFSVWLAVNPAGVQDTILSATMTATPSGLTIGSTTNTASRAMAMISGGTDGATYVITCVVTTAAGLIAQSQETLAVSEGVR